MKKNRKFLLETTVPISGKRAEIFEHLINSLVHKDTHGVYYLLGGPTGIGKTTMIKDLGKILGMPVLDIEIPHVIEEMIINIPFVEFPPLASGKKSGKKGSVNYDINKGKIVLAQSYLLKLLNSKTNFIPESEYLNYIQYKLDPNLKSILLQLYDNLDTVPNDLKWARQYYNRIFFMDEYWRAVPPIIRNAVRGLLNRQLGMDKIPAHVAIFFASNIFDEGLDEIPANVAHAELDLASPSKDEFFSFLKTKHPNLNQKVISAFENNMTDDMLEDLKDGSDKYNRTSPRRWEQIILYVNDAFFTGNKPKISSTNKQRAFLASIKSMFTDAGNNVGKNYEVVKKVISEIDPSHADKALTSLDWKKSLSHQIETKINLGNKRTYVPIIVGAPGIGKTKSMDAIAHEFNLIPVTLEIDQLGLQSQDVTGIPIKNTEDSETGVIFTKPKLLEIIEHAIKTATEKYLSDPEITQEDKTAWQTKSGYKYLLLLDEFNRVTAVNTYNSLRKLLLDKEFNSSTQLPDDILLVAAMNPKDNEQYITDLTDHMLDAVDLVKADPSWKKFWDFLTNHVDKKLNPEIDKNAYKVSKDILKSFVDTFSVGSLKTWMNEKIPTDSYPFYMAQGKTLVYIQPRVYEALYTRLTNPVYKMLQQLKKSQDVSQVIEKYTKQMAEIIWQHLAKPFKQAGITADKSEQISIYTRWLSTLLADEISKKGTSSELGSMLDATFDDPTHQTHLGEHDNWHNYIKHFDNNKFKEEVHRYIMQIIEKSEKEYDIILKANYPEKVLQNKKVELTEKLVSKIHRIITELHHATINYDSGKQKISNQILDIFTDTLAETMQSMVNTEQASRSGPSTSGTGTQASAPKKISNENIKFILQLGNKVWEYLKNIPAIKSISPESN